MVTSSEWRARVEKDLAGRPFERALVHRTLEGLAIEPLYTEAPALPRVLGDGAPFRICMRHDAATSREALAADVEGGADGLWLAPEAVPLLPADLPPHVWVLVDETAAVCRLCGTEAALVSTLEAHLQGADACDEIAMALSTTVAWQDARPSTLLVRVSAGRDTFVELCKLRALRLCLRKVLAVAGDGWTARLLVHSVASPRTLTGRDAWVNILRVTTETFAGIVGGADLVTPLPFDEALEESSLLGRRVARNTGHVLREECGLGRVVDAGAGSYYLDTLTDALAREAWSRFREIEREGGVARALAGGSLAGRLAATDKARREQVARRRLPILGVSEFANLDERLPSAPRADEGSARRDDAPFEELRRRAAARPSAETEVLLVPLGPFAESRPRVGFSVPFFAAGGLRARELGEEEAAPEGSIACLCGSDERYAQEAVWQARALREAGCRRVLLAGRPGALEAGLREAGVDEFIFVGCDVLKVLSGLLEVER